MSTEVATRLTDEALAAAATADLETDLSEIRVPILKIAQSLTREVKGGDAEEGDFVNSLTGEALGRSVQMVVVDAFKGRFWKNQKTGKAFSTGRGEPVIPWEEHPEYGKHFVDAADAEEQYREAVHNNEKDWGKGPGISTTYNFVGLLVDEDGELAGFPVRVSLMRSAAKEGRNFQTMLNIARAPWDNVYELSTRDATSSRGEPYIAVKVKPVGKTTPEQRQAALDIAQAIHGGAAVRYDDDLEAGTDAPAKPAETGGLADSI